MTGKTIKNIRMRKKMSQINVFDEPISECCSNPITGYFRNGFCHTDKHDRCLHIVCSLITEDFLSFSKSRGNDLSTSKPEFNFPGLKDGVKRTATKDRENHIV